MDPMKLAWCRGCGAPIVWTVTANGKRMPVDAYPIVASQGFRLQEEVLDVALQYSEQLIATFTVAPGSGERLYISHFSTCPDAARFRKPA
jgi:hypothetical protein